jgi:hypothetical protein
MRTELMPAALHFVEVSTVAQTSEPEVERISRKKIRGCPHSRLLS